MSTDPNIAALVRVMPPRGSVGASVDWSTVERSWGRRLPADYVAFIETYGGGGIEDYLEVHAPEPLDDRHTFQGMVAETQTARLTWKEYPQADSTSSEEEAPLVAWGTDASADLLCWLTVEPDPDKWPVAIWKRGRNRWTVLDCGMAEFLLKVFRAELDENPLSDVALWGNASPVFISQAEEQRLRASGIDPWTGEPSANFGMFGD
jgi:hypothetical protein